MERSPCFIATGIIPYIYIYVYIYVCIYIDIYIYVYIYIWLVVLSHSSEKYVKVSQLGLWHSIYCGK